MLKEYEKIKCIKIRQDEYWRLGNVGMVYLETEEANAAIQSLIETTRYIAKKYELKKQTNIDSQEEIHTNRAKEIEKKATNWSQTSMNT